MEAFVCHKCKEGVQNSQVFAVHWQKYWEFYRHNAQWQLNLLFTNWQKIQLPGKDETVICAKKYIGHYGKKVKEIEGQGNLMFWSLRLLIGLSTRLLLVTNVRKVSKIHRVFFCTFGEV